MSDGKSTNGTGMARGSTVRVDSELWWYFNDASGELGMRSSFGSMVDQILGGGGRSQDVLLPVESDRAHAAVRRWRQVHAVLSVLTQAQRDVLRAFHLQKDRGHLDLVYPDNFAGVVLWLARQRPKKSEQDAWRSRAYAAVFEAMHAWREACGDYRNARVDARLERLERIRRSA